MSPVPYKTFVVKFRDKSARTEEWLFTGYRVGDAYDAYKEFKPEGAQLLSISEQPLWD